MRSAAEPRIANSRLEDRSQGRRFGQSCTSTFAAFLRAQRPYGRASHARNGHESVEAAARDWLEHRDVEPHTLVDLLLANLFSQLLLASQLAPDAKVRLDLAAGLRVLGPILGRVMAPSRDR